MKNINLEPKKFNENEIQKKVFEDRWVRFAFGPQGFTKSKNLNFGVVQFEKDKTSLTHAHDVEEALYVLAGKGIIDVDGIIYNVKKGDFLYIPIGCKHTIITGNNSRLKILFVFGGEIKIDY
jgi:quercetin dioxygenase-like cupin family protein